MMLKRFSVISIFYSISAYLLAAYIILTNNNIDLDEPEFWSSVILVIHGTAQVMYTLSSRRMLHLVPYKEMDTLDDFMAQPMDIDTQIIENSGWMKTLAFLGILGCIVSIVSGAMMFYYILQTVFSPWRDFREVSLVFISLAALGFGIPTLVYNIRTFAFRGISQTNS